MANPTPTTYKAYRENQTLGWARIDLILATYDGIMTHLERARTLLDQADQAAAAPLLAKARIGVGALALGIDPGAGDLSGNFRRLYEYVLYCLKDAHSDRIAAALNVLEILRQAFQAVRKEAVELERAGTIPSIDRKSSVQATA